MKRKIKLSKKSDKKTKKAIDKLLKTLGSSAKNLKKGKASDPIDLNMFED